MDRRDVERFHALRVLADAAFSVAGEDTGCTKICVALSMPRVYNRDSQ